MISSQALRDMMNLKSPKIIAISGFGGSGKSTVAKLLGEEINVPVIGVDSFYNPNKLGQYRLWEVMDYNRLESEVLIPFLDGEKTISYGEYDWECNQGSVKATVEVQNVIIVEGVGLFRPELMKYFSYKIWIDCPIEVAITRGKKRDKEYGVSQDVNWDGIWKNNDIQYF